MGDIPGDLAPLINLIVAIMLGVFTAWRALAKPRPEQIVARVNGRHKTDEMNVVKLAEDAMLNKVVSTRLEGVEHRLDLQESRFVTIERRLDEIIVLLLRTKS